MSTPNSTLETAIAALGATVELQTYVPTHTNDEFGQAAKAAIDAGHATFEFDGTTFKLEITSAHQVNRIFVLQALGQPLPEVFDSGRLALKSIIIQCPVPERLLPAPGMYVGPGYGFTTGACMIDPTGELGGDGPCIYADEGEFKEIGNARVFGTVTGLFVAVMSGELAPNGYEYIED